MMKEIRDWLGKDAKLDRAIAEQAAAIAESKRMSERASKVQRDVAKSVTDALKIVNNTWGPR